MNLNRTAPSALEDKILQFGEGGFLRGFVDWMVDRMNKQLHMNYGVVIVQPLEQGMTPKLDQQDGLYTLLLRGIENGETREETTLVECINRTVNPYTAWEDYLALAHNPATQFIVSNTTEAGIEFREEAMSAAPNLTYPGKLTLLLKERYDTGLDGFILIPCELIDKNGAMLKKCVLQYAALWNLGGDFIRWIEEKNTFLSTLVDRIVTGYPREEAAQIEEKLGYHDEMLDTAELFHLWVIEGESNISRLLPFDQAGLNVVWTHDVTPYKMRKVRILNGAHTMMVLAAHLAGLETVRDAMEDKLFYTFLQKGIFEEIIPTLPLAKEELESFANAVLERFANPFIKHYLLSIALNSVSKFKVRVLPSLLEYQKEFDKLPPALTFSLAALIVFYRTDAANDVPETVSFMKDASVADILAREDYWGKDLSFLCSAIEEHVDAIEQKGVRQAMETIL